MQKVTSISHLAELAANGLDCAILLAGGAARSSKYVTYEDGLFHILNDIDGRMQHLTEEELAAGDQSNIGIAIERGALVY
tara:strand:+ start:882 stop:1121 length:240 start_codon:yes stop_codon:yes gene_type:complete